MGRRLTSPLILASSSRRRRDLLAAVGVPFEIAAPTIDESIHDGESPARAARRLACEKAEEAARSHAGRVVLAADTIVSIDGDLLGKPRDPAEARRMLRRLSGSWHEVHTGVALIDAKGTLRQAQERTDVLFATLLEREIRRYVAGGEPMDKAGAYAIQEAGGWFVERVRGSVSNVIGLPLGTVRRLLAEGGFPLPPLRPVAPLSR